MASITNTTPIVESRPSWGRIGTMSDDVVMTETVDDPWAVFNAAARIKGSNKPASQPRSIPPR